MSTTTEPLELITDLVGKAQTAGADSADAIHAEGISLSSSQRLGKPEHLERSESVDIGLRVFTGTRQAIVSSSDVSAAALDELVERAMAMVRSVPEDPYCGIAPEELLASTFPDLDDCDPSEPSSESLQEQAAEAEDAARGVEGVTNSEGAEAGWSRNTVILAATNGFARSRSATTHSLSVSVLAGEGTAMERDYDYALAVHGDDLPSPNEIGRSAGERAVRRLNPRTSSTDQVPVIYDPRVSNSILGHLSSAVNGASVARGTTFLKDKLGETVFSKGVNVVDDPLRKRGLRSKAFDGEGVQTRRRHTIEDGVLAAWTLDLRSARQLGLTTTGNASRGTSSPPAPRVTNYYMEPGSVSRDDLIGDVKTGLYVTELIGMGVNGVTGDYSRGASGFWIENGEIAFPVSEVTVAGNLLDMFASLTPADDLEFKYGTNAPTLRIDGMTVAGK